MGFIYDKHNRLCCDNCSQSGGVKKRRCTYNWCPPPALCDECYKALRTELKEYHKKHCKQAHEEYQAQQQSEQELLAEGHFLRKAAMNDNGKVKVVFRNQEEKEQYVLMDQKTYRTFPIGDPVTLEQFQAVGEVIPTDKGFYA